MIAFLIAFIIRSQAISLPRHAAEHADFAARYAIYLRAFNARRMAYRRHDAFISI